jgi:hypothetical protein
VSITVVALAIELFEVVGEPAEPSQPIIEQKRPQLGVSGTDLGDNCG